MKLLLTSAGISNQSINDALVRMLGKPISESSALFVPTALHPFPGGPAMARQAILGEARSPLCELGWSSLGVLELTALPSIKREAWVPELRQSDALLVWGGDVMYLFYWMKKSGLADLLPSLERLVYVGVSAGSIVMTPYNHDAEFNLKQVPEHSDRGREEGDRALGFVDFTLVPHLDHPNFVPEHSAASIQAWAAGLPVPTYAIDDDTAITVTDNVVEVVSEGHWELFTPDHHEGPTAMDRGRHIQDESDRFGAVLEGCDPGSRVPTCPEWTALDLLKHLVTVQRFWAVVIGDRLNGAAVADYERSRPPLPEDATALQALRRQATTDLLTALRSRDASEPAWSWFAPDQTVGFSWRMQTHEATMHRVDAELAAGLPISPIATSLAEDGLDHVVDVMWAWAPPEAERRITGTVELVATDTGRRWLVRTFRWSGEAWEQEFTDQIGCERADNGEPDATISGTAEDLDLLVWTRADRGITRAGSEEVLGELQAMLDDGIQ